MQEKLDELLVRIKKLVQKYGGNATELSQVRSLYSVVYARPEHASIALLECAIEEAELLSPSTEKASL